MQACAWVLRHEERCPFIGTGLQCLGCKKGKWVQGELDFKEKFAYE